MGPSSDADTTTLETRPFSQFANAVSKRKRVGMCAESLMSREITSQMDPFDAAPVRIDHTVFTLLQYYMHTYHPTTWPNEMMAKPRGLYAFRGAVEHIMAVALTDELAMCCLLSASASRFWYIDRLSAPASSEKESSYMDRALQLIRVRIDKEGSGDIYHMDCLLQNIMFLASAEAYRDNFKPAQTHLEAAARLLDSRGGIMQLENPNLQGQLLMTDLFLACINLQPCVFGDEYDPGSADVLALTRWELSPLEYNNMATNLLVKGDAVVPTELKSSIQQIVESYSIKAGLRTETMSLSRAMETTHWITKRNMAIRNRLLAFTTTNTAFHALRIALIMWTLLTMNLTGRTKTVKIMARTLRSVMRHTTEADWNGADDIRLWIFLVGYTSAKADSGASNWFFAQSCRFGALDSPLTTILAEGETLSERLEKFQSGFLYDARVQRPRIEELVRGVAQSKGSR